MESVIKVSLVEIYCEKVCDLLNPDKVDLVITQDTKTGIKIENVTEVTIANEEDMVMI